MTEQEQKNIIHNINFGYRLDAAIYTLQRCSLDSVGGDIGPYPYPKRACIGMPVKLKYLKKVS